MLEKAFPIESTESIMGDEQDGNHGLLDRDPMLDFILYQEMKKEKRLRRMPVDALG
jgi:hypothetical protein